MIKFQQLDTAMRQQVEKLDTAEKPTKLQSIPFIIDAEGPARVADYFDHKTKEEIIKSQTSTEKVFTNSFHGRALKGKSVKLPSDITGILDVLRNILSFTIGIVYERSVQKDVIYKPQAFVKELTYIL